MEKNIPLELLVLAIKHALDKGNYIELDVAGLDVGDLPAWFTAAFVGLGDEVSAIRKLLATTREWEPLDVVALVAGKLVVLLVPIDGLLAKAHFDRDKLAEQVEFLERVATAKALRLTGKKPPDISDIPEPVQHTLETISTALARISSRSTKAQVLFPHRDGKARPLNLPRPEDLQPKDNLADGHTMKCRGRVRHVLRDLCEVILDNNIRLMVSDSFPIVDVHEGDTIICQTEIEPVQKKYLRTCSSIMVSQPALHNFGINTAAGGSEVASASNPAEDASTVMI